MVLGIFGMSTYSLQRICKQSNYALENGRADKQRAVDKRQWRRAAQRER